VRGRRRRPGGLGRPAARRLPGDAGRCTRDQDNAAQYVRQRPGPHDEITASFKIDRQKMFKILFRRHYRHLAEDEAMPYSPKHKRDTREKILESARRLFNRNGYFR
jgi:hypothetical protein